MSKIIGITALLLLVCLNFSCGLTLQCGSISSGPMNNLSLDELSNNSDHWNVWENAEALKNKVKQLANVSGTYHGYIENEYDCNDMAVDIWNMLEVNEPTPIQSIIVIGNLDEEDETFEDCNHAWLVILNKPEGGVVTIYALEPTNAEIYKYTGDKNAPAAEYFNGFFYEKPSDLRADLGDRW